MKFRTRHFEQAHHGMNLVPLIDVLFILLIFFIVTFAMARFETELNISVPAAENTESNQRKVGETIVNIRADGTIVVNNLVLDEQNLMTRMADIARVDRKRAVIIRGDQTSQFKHIVRVLDVIHRAGLYHVSFAAQQTAKAE
jgi:biopolymer transport protein ExbD